MTVSARKGYTTYLELSWPAQARSQGGRQASLWVSETNDNEWFYSGLVEMNDAMIRDPLHRSENP